jgi:thioredoxin-related protein
VKSTFVRAAFVLAMTGAFAAAPELIGAGSVAFAACRHCNSSNPRKCKCRGRCPCHKRGSSSRTSRPRVKLVPVAWKGLDGALSSAKGSNKPVVLVFATEKLKSAATFNRASNTRQVAAMRKALVASGAMAVKLTPPKVPNVRGMDREAVKLAAKAHGVATKKYLATAKKYGATTYPTMVFLAPQGEVMGRLYCPNAQTVCLTLKALPAAVKAFQAKKAEKAEKARKDAEKSAKETASSSAKPSS